MKELALSWQKKPRLLHGGMARFVVWMLVVATAGALVLPPALVARAAAAPAPDVQDGARAVEAGIRLTYDAAIMDTNPITGLDFLRYPISGAEVVDPSGLLLIFGALATRLGGLLPDELPFNIVQKVLRAVPGVNTIVPDYADDDYRKQFQDNWYGTSTKAELPEWLRSRSSSNVLTRPPPSAAEEEEGEKEEEAEKPMPSPEAKEVEDAERR